MTIQFHSRPRGVSPILATILLVALVIVGGALTFIVLAGVFTQNTPLDLEIETMSDFRSEDGDVRVDRFQISITNLRTETAVVKRTEISVFNKTGVEAELNGWQVQGTSTEYLLSGKETVDLTLICDTPNHELLPRADRIQVQFNGYRSDDRDDNPKLFKSSTVTVGQTYGPVGLSVESTHALDSNLTLTVSNNGTTDLEDLVIEVSGENSFFFNGTSYKASAAITLEGITVNPSRAVTPGGVQTLYWYVNASASLASGTYFVSVWITDSSFQTMAFTLVSFAV
ncbi:MAG: archaellin/type IV pilin N-terminal domain-containing protein [Candidatus Heimdallarchaeota archaeon]